jgi:hypothetical protein
VAELGRLVAELLHLAEQQHLAKETTVAQQPVHCRTQVAVAVVLADLADLVTEPGA